MLLVHSLYFKGTLEVIKVQKRVIYIKVCNLNRYKFSLLGKISNNKCFMITVEKALIIISSNMSNYLYCNYSRSITY